MNSKSIDTLMKELIAAGYKTSDITAAAEKAERERKRLEAEAAQLKISAARDRAAIAFADYLLTLGVEEVMGVSKEEAVELAKNTFNDMEAEVQRTLNMMKRCRVAQDVDSDFDQAIAKFLKDIGALN